MDDYPEEFDPYYDTRRSSRTSREITDEGRHYDRVNGELRDVAWKLYDLTCDFKELQIDAKQLCSAGRYDNYESHKRLFEKLNKVASTKEDKDYRSKRKERDENRRDGSSKQKLLMEYENLFEKFLKKHPRDSEGCKDREFRCRNKYEQPESPPCCRNRCGSEYNKNRCGIKNAPSYSLESRDGKDRTFQCRKDARQSVSSSTRENTSRSSNYDGLPSEELEQRLRDRLSTLQRKTKCMKESFCKQEEERGSHYGTKNENSRVSNNVICCRGKQNLGNLHSPHRVYLDGSRTYVVDHTDSKVIFVPKDYEF